MHRLLLLFIIITANVTGSNAQLPSGTSLLPGNTEIFTVHAPRDTASGIESIDTKGQPFTKAYRVTVVKQAGSAGYTVKAPIDAAVSKGDVLLLSFYTRTLQSKRETGEAFMEISLDRTVAGKYQWPPLFERGMSFGPAWVLTQIPLIAARDVQTGELSVVVKGGNVQQVFELGALTLVNYRQAVKLNDLPRSIVHYGGDAPNAPWRKAAAERIEKYRKGNLLVKVMNENGKPLPDAEVSVRMTTPAFAWGTATNSKIILDTTGENAKNYHEVLLGNFNKVVLENEMKSKNWDRADHAQTLRALQWLDVHHIPVRGHVMVWPSWDNSPHLVKFKNDTAALRAAILKNISDETTLMKGRFTEWDVVNEPYAHDDFLKLLGREVMVDWFRAARKGAPGVKLFLNDYTMFQSEAASEKFYDNIKFLKDNHAPIDAIGEQGHIGGSAPGIDTVIARLDHFAKLGLPIQISEFDITSDDDDFKARYMHDFMTAVYSHPAVIGLMQWGFWESQHWIPAAALWDKNWNIRENGKVYAALINQTWHTRANGRTAKDGTYKVRGFTGKYDVVVKYGNRQVTRQTTLNADGQTLMVKMAN